MKDGNQLKTTSFVSCWSAKAVLLGNSWGKLHPCQHGIFKKTRVKLEGIVEVGDNVRNVKLEA